MSDKLNLLTSNIIRFVAGERPTADKFNAMNVYYTRAVDNICRAIGDMHDRSAHEPLSPQWNPNEADLNGRPLDIANLARLIGPASNLNPKMFGTNTIKERVESLTNKEVELKYTPFKILLPTSTFPFFEVTRVQFQIERYNSEDDTLVGTLEEDKYLFLNDKVILFTYELPDNEYLLISYLASGVSVEGGANYLGASFNTIPDPNEESGLSEVGNIITDVSAGSSGYLYKIDLSERKIKKQQSKSRDLTLSSVEAEDEFNNNKSYSLPDWWQSKFDLNGQIQSLPSGSIYLKNINTGEVYLTAEYAASDLHTIYIRSANLCLTDEHRLILVGTDITTSIDDLRNKMFNHRHDGSFGEPFIRIQDLIGKYVTGEFGPSSIPGNEFPMYLHRKGYQVDDNARNGNNAMLGDVFMGNTLFSSTGEIESRFLNSHKIIFGSEESYIVKALGTLLISNIYQENDEFRGNILLRSSNEIQLNSRVNKMLGQASNILEAENNYIESTNNTEINSDNETHLQIENEDVIVLKDRGSDVSANVSSYNYYNKSYSVDTSNVTWSNSEVNTISYNSHLKEKNYKVIDFSPSLFKDTLVPCGVVTQHDRGGDQNDNPYLFLNNIAEIKIDGELITEVPSHSHLGYGHTLTKSYANFDSFIFNYNKRRSIPVESLNEAEFGIWNDNHQLDSGGDSNVLEDWTTELRLKSGQTNVEGNSNIEVCFGGNVWNSFNIREKTGQVYEITSYNNSGEWERSFHYDDKDGFIYNRAGIVKPRALIKNEDLGWVSGSVANVEGSTYNFVQNTTVLPFRVIGSRGAQIVSNNQANNPWADYQENLLKEFNLSYGVRVKISDDSGTKYSWLKNEPDDKTNKELGVHYDFEWQWSEVEDAEINLVLKINPRRLYQARASDLLSDLNSNGSNYTFEVFYRPYNYTRASLQPSFMQVLTRRNTNADNDEGVTWGDSKFAYVFLTSDYDLNESSKLAEKDTIDQRYPVCIDPNFITNEEPGGNLTVPSAKRLLPLSAGVINKDYFPSTSLETLSTKNYGNDYEENPLIGIHSGDDEKIYRAASVGNSRQSIQFDRNFNFGNAISKKEYYINTNGGDNTNGSFYLSDSYFFIRHNNNVYYNENFDFYRQFLNFYERPNFILSYSGANESTTIDVSLNGKDVSADVGLVSNIFELQNGKAALNLSEVICNDFSENIWYRQYFHTTVFHDEDEESLDNGIYLASRYAAKYSTRQSLLSFLNTSKNWLDVQYDRSHTTITTQSVGEDGTIPYLVTEPDTINSTRNWMAGFIQAMLGGDNTNQDRMPIVIRNGSYTKDILFDIKCKISEEYNSYIDHLSIKIDCKYIIKHKKVRSRSDDNIPLFAVNKGVGFSSQNVYFRSRI